MATQVIGIECDYCIDVIEIPFVKKYDFQIGDSVVFKDSEGKEDCGAIVYYDKTSGKDDKILFNSVILRKATPNDLQRVQGNKALAEKALEKCKEIVLSLGLEMDVFKAGYSFDGTKAHFLFTADDRVDFRELVKELAKAIQKQIHLRQIGPRDKAKLTGGYGRCGRTLCCSTWLGELGNVSMDFVRTQGMESKGSSKLSGSCGKLLCCLKYEVEAYKSLRKNLPSMGAKVKVEGVPDSGTVIGLDIINQKVKLAFSEDEVGVFDLKQINK